MALTADDVHTYTKDIAEFNILLEGEEQSSSELVELAMRLAVSSFNSVPPFTTYTVENFPDESLLLTGTLYGLANGEAERQLRNQATFNIQGGQASIDDKYQQYLGLATFYKTILDPKTQQMKQYLNTEAAWGEAYSPYIGINTYNFRD